ncbi:MAG: spore germination protein GerW family protein [Candidatus Caccosoma sp.]|nr:spore germination protein GerW family protein [Candidatus Caccosoma sp.]
MKEHPINEILKTSLENIDELVNTNKAFGEPIVLPDNVIVIPVSKVIYGYGVGGSQFNNKQNSNVKSEMANDIFPFGGGSGGGVTINPTALIIIKDGTIKMLSIEKENDVLPKIVDSIKEMFKK